MEQDNERLDPMVQDATDDAPADPVPFDLARALASKKWEERSVAYDRLLSSSDRSSLFELVSKYPGIFLDESSARGQEAALKCICEWSKGLVSFSGTSESMFLREVLLKYSLSSASTSRELLFEILKTIDSRFGKDRSSSFLSKTLVELVDSLISPKPHTDPKSKSVTKGLLNKQLIACLSILSAWLVSASPPSLLGKATTLRVCDLVNFTSVDRAVRDACYTFFVSLHQAGSLVGIDTLPLNPAQAKELTTRLTGNPVPISPSRPISVSKPELSAAVCQEPPVVHCDTSRSTLASPTESTTVDLLKSLGGKDWIATISTVGKWQDRLVGWRKVCQSVQSRGTARLTLSADIMGIITNSLQSELNAVILIEACRLVELLLKESPHAGISVVQIKQILSSLIPRLKDKTPSIQRAVQSALTAIGRAYLALIDTRFIQYELGPITLLAKREVLSFIDQLLPLSTREPVLLTFVIGPCFDDSDPTIREIAVKLTQRLLADCTAASVVPNSPSTIVEECMQAISGALAPLSPARRKVVEAALGLPIMTREEGRPKTATITMTRAPLSSSRRSVSAGRVSRESLAVPTIQLKPVKTLLHSQSRFDECVLKGSNPLNLAMQANVWRGILADTCSDSIVPLMVKKSSAHTSRILTLWLHWVSDTSNADAVTAIGGILIAWVVAVSPDNHASVGLIEAIVENLNRPMVEWECKLVVSHLANANDRSSVPSVRLLSSLLGEPDKLGSFDVVPLLCSGIAKGRAAELNELLSLLLRWISSEHGIATASPRSKRACAVVITRSFGGKGKSTVTAEWVSEISKNDPEMHAALVSVLRSEPNFSPARSALWTVVTGAGLERVGRSVLSDRTNLSAVSLSSGRKSPRVVSRPSTAPAGSSPVITAFTNAITSGDADRVVTVCTRIQDALESSNVFVQQAAEPLISAIAKCLNSVLESSDSVLRQAALLLVHNVTRAADVWILVTKQTLTAFVGALLSAVADKTLRTQEPEIWADLNLSVVHAIANSTVATAYSALLELDQQPTMRSLTLRCIDKLNRSLPRDMDSPECKARVEDVLTAVSLRLRALAIARAGDDNSIDFECTLACIRGVCSVAGLAEVGEYVGRNVKSPRENQMWKKLLKLYTSTEKRVIPTETS